MALPPVIAYFITPHGFGHASRAAAVMSALFEEIPSIRFELFTSCPQWIFKESLEADFGYHPVHTDIGLVQTSPLKQDLTGTCRELDQMLPFSRTFVEGLAAEIRELNCRMVVCDIAPLGIAAARVAGVPSVLIENFTWDWIYSGYLEAEPGLKPHIEYLAGIFRQADHHIQISPLCNPMKDCIKTGPISRKARSPRSRVRSRLGIGETDKMVLVSMGGVPDRFDFLSTLPGQLEPFLVISGAAGRRPSHPRVLLLPAQSDFYHPDLIRAADALVAKAGYSTVAEAYQSNLPFAYICRPDSPESDALEKFIVRHLPSRSISPEAYAEGTWIGAVNELLALPRPMTQRENGSRQTARFIGGILMGHGPA